MFLLRSLLSCGCAWPLSLAGSFPHFTWPSEAPADIPFQQSELFNIVEFTGNYATYGGADTWYPSWAADGDLYSPWTDGSVEGLTAGSGCQVPGCMSSTGFAVISGEDPLNLTVRSAGIFRASPAPYHGRYPSASLHYNGTWLYGTYMLDNERKGLGAGAGESGYCGNWCILGPFVGFRWSRDNGRTWTEPRLRVSGYADNIFGEAAPDNHTRKVKYGAPHVVDLGRELEHRPLGDDRPMMYIVGHGASSAFSPATWIQGSEVYMARVEPSVEAVQDRSSWEFYAGDGAWVSGDVERAKPLLSWGNRTGVTTMTYIPAVKRYFLCVTTPTFSPETKRQFDTYLLEAERITGPFKYISYLREFGPEAYFVNVPSKFVAPRLEEDGSLRLFLSYSANFAFHHGSRPPGSGYHWTLTEVLLKRRTELAV